MEPKKRKKKRKNANANRLGTKYRIHEIEEISDDLVGRIVWFFHPRHGVVHILVTGVYNHLGRKGLVKWGLMYDRTDAVTGRVHSRTLWLTDYPLFTTRQRCEKWIRALLEKSKLDAYMDAAMGFQQDI